MKKFPFFFEYTKVTEGSHKVLMQIFTGSCLPVPVCEGEYCELAFGLRFVCSRLIVERFGVSGILFTQIPGLFWAGFFGRSTECRQIHAFLPFFSALSPWIHFESEWFCVFGLVCSVNEVNVRMGECVLECCVLAGFGWFSSLFRWLVVRVNPHGMTWQHYYCTALLEPNNWQAHFGCTSLFPR